MYNSRFANMSVNIGNKQLPNCLDMCSQRLHIYIQTPTRQKKEKKKNYDKLKNTLSFGLWVSACPVVDPLLCHLGADFGCYVSPGATHRHPASPAFS